MAVQINEASGWRKPILVFVAAALGAVVAGVMLWPDGTPTPSVGDGSASKNVSWTQATSPAVGGATGLAAAGSTPVIEVDVLGARMDVSRLFQLGFGGGLTLDAETRATLDTLLVQMPDPPTEKDNEKLEYTLRQGLPKEEAEKALRLFQGYRSYQADLRSAGPQLGIPENAQSVDTYFNEVARIQHRHFDDATANALFGPDMRNARAVMMAAVIDQDPNLTQQQKQAQIDALRADLPADQRGIVPDPTVASAPEAK